MHAYMGDDVRSVGANAMLVVCSELLYTYTLNWKKKPHASIMLLGFIDANTTFSVHLISVFRWHTYTKRDIRVLQWIHLSQNRNSDGIYKFGLQRM